MHGLQFRLSLCSDPREKLCRSRPHTDASYHARGKTTSGTQGSLWLLETLAVSVERGLISRTAAGN